MAPGFLAVKNFERFQHYRDRAPLWIKLYNALLDDYAFTELPEVTRSHLVLIWLLASRHGNRLPNDAKFIGRAIHAKSKVNIALLVASGFLIPLLATSEQPASDLVQNATSPCAGGEGELETENKEPSTAPVEIAPVHLGKTPGERSLALRLETDADRLALTTICAKVPSAVSWVAEASGALDGMHGPQLTPVQLGEALRDYVANGALNSPSLQHFRKYLRRAAVPYMPAKGLPGNVDSALDTWARDSDAKERKRA